MYFAIIFFNIHNIVQKLLYAAYTFRGLFQYHPIFRAKAREECGRRLHRSPELKLWVSHVGLEPGGEVRAGAIPTIIKYGVSHTTNLHTRL